MQERDYGFPFLPEEKVTICPSHDCKHGVLFPIVVSDLEQNNTRIFRNYELGREGLTLYIREGLWCYTFGALSGGIYFFIESHIDDSDAHNPFRPHLH